HDDGLAAEVVLEQGRDHELARTGLLALGDRVLEVEEHLVRVEPGRLREKALAGSGHGVAGTAGAKHEARHTNAAATLTAPVRSALLAILMLLVAAPAASAATTIALEGPSSETTFGDTTTLKGMLSADGTALAGHTIELEGR